MLKPLSVILAASIAAGCAGGGAAGVRSTASFSFKQVATVFERRLAEESRRFPRAVGLDERYTNVLPDVLITLSLEEFAALAAQALEPKPDAVVGLAHIHANRVSVRRVLEHVTIADVVAGELPADVRALLEDRDALVGH